MDELLRRVAVLTTLTPRERDVLRLTCANLTQREVAEQLVIATRTVKFHAGHIYEKLGIVELRGGARQRELARYCDALKAGRDEPVTALAVWEPEPTQPSPRALAAVEEDDTEREQRAPMPAVRSTMAPTNWRDPVPVPPIEQGPHHWWQSPPAMVAMVVAAALLGAGTVALLLGRGRTTVSPTVFVTPLPAVAVLQPTMPSPLPRPETPSPTTTPVPTPVSSPTPRPPTGPTFVVNAQPVGCHAAPDPTAAIIVQRATGTIQAMDQVITLPDGTWHREVSRQCWTRTAPGLAEVFTDHARARSAAARLAPAGTVLYQADWSQGADGWLPSDGWKVAAGLLLNDGGGGFIAAPYTPGLDGLNDYAVEAEIQAPRGLGNDYFAIVARADGGYYACVCGSIADGISAVIGAGGFFGGIANRRFNPGNGWHRYRLEVTGNTVTFLIDGAVALTVTDNRFLSGGKAGLHTIRAQVSVRSFTIIKL